MRLPRSRRTWSLLGPLLTGCTGATTDHALRQAWLVDAITADNRVWQSRDPALLAHKYDRMADDPYDFFRGTAAVSFADWSRVTGDRARSPFPGSSEAASVLLMGDPHPENVGTYLPGPAPEPTDRTAPIILSLEFTDFDGAGYGPWSVDVRRGAQGLALLATSGGCEDDCAEAVVSEFAAAYADEIGARATGMPGWPSGTTGATTTIIDRLVREAVTEGLGRKRLMGWTRHTAAGRRFRFDQALDAWGEGTLAVTPDERKQVDRLVADWLSEAPPGTRVRDVARRYGMGVASVPAVRYALIVDRGAEGSEDDTLVMFREVVDPAPLPGLHPAPRWLWDDNAHRVVEAARRLWSRPDADPWMAALTDGDTTFKVVTGSSFQEGLDHDGILEDLRVTDEPLVDLVDLAGTLGRMLASNHARGGTFAGGSSLDAIHDDLVQRSDDLVAFSVEAAFSDAEQLRLDHRLFLSAREELGPWLGADREVPSW